MMCSGGKQMRDLVLASIILATYNGEKYLIEQLQSIHKQTYNNIEVYIVDDKSTDNTAMLVREFIEKNDLSNSWHFVVNKSNKGWRRNFIEGMKMCEGKYIFPCDQDDVWMENKVSSMVRIMEANKEINLLASNVIEFSDANKNIRTLLPNGNDVIKKDISKHWLDVELPGCSYCVRKRFFEKNLHYWWEKEAHDAFLWRYSLFSHSLFLTEEPLIRQRIHSDSTYRVEAFHCWKYEDKKNEIDYLKHEVLNIIDYCCNDDIKLSGKENRILYNGLKWVEARNNLYQRWNLTGVLKLARYSGYYSRKRTFLLDNYLSFLHFIKKGNNDND